VWLRDYESLPEDELTAMGAQPRGDRALRLEPLHVQPKLRARLHRIRIPTLFLWGAQTASHRSLTAGDYCAAIPPGEFEEVLTRGISAHGAARGRGAAA